MSPVTQGETQVATIAAEDLTALTDSLHRLLQDKCTETDVRRTMETPEGYDQGLWRQIAEMGVAGIVVDEAYGGVGAGAVELERVMEEAGAVLLCSPLLSSVLAAGLIQALGDEAAKSRLLPGIADGSKIATVALAGARGGWTADDVAVTAAGAGDAWTLRGKASFVTHAQIADVILVVARAADGLAVFEVEPGATGIVVVPLPTFDHTLRLADLTFEATPAKRLSASGPVWAAVENALDLVRVALAGEQAGGARRALEFTVDYAKTRAQFGRLIGSSTRRSSTMAADYLLLESESATSAARAAARSLADGDAGRASAAISTSPPSPAPTRSARSPRRRSRCTGGIAFTWATPSAHLYLRRARAVDAQAVRDAGPPIAERYLRRPWAHEAGEPDHGRWKRRSDRRRAARTKSSAWLADNWKARRKPQPGAVGGAGWTVSPEQRAWTAKVVDARWAVPRWPAEWLGRGLPDAQARIVEREFAKVGAPGTGQDRSNLWANTALAYATSTFKAKIVPKRRCSKNQVGDVLCCIPSRAPGRTSPASAPAPIARAITSSSTARRSGPAARPPPTTAC